jgi:hypothetical protein
MKNLTLLNRKRILAATILGAVLTATFIIMLSTQPISTQTTDQGCYVSPGQTVVRWKSMYWFPCQVSIKGVCIWPIRRRHITYKVTVTDGIPLRDEKGRPIATAKGEKRDWLVYDAAAWKALGDDPVQRARYPDYEPIAENEYVVAVETRYQWFNNVEATLGICTEKQ